MSALAFNLAAASLLVLLVLAIRRPVAAAFGPRAAFALWLAPALRLVMPPLPAAATPAAAADGAVTWTAVVAPAAAAARPMADLLLLAWAAGALVMLGWHLAVHTRFVRRALAGGTPFPVDGVTVDVVATPAVEGPMATGLVHPLILVPLDFAGRFDPDQQRLALLHEQMHHRRGDIWASAAALLGASALWFNPFAHIALGAFRRDMESACDASLLAAAGRAAAPQYARTILASAARPVPRSLCALTSIDELKGRLQMLNANHGAVRRIAGLLVAGGLAAAGLALAAPAAAGQERETRTETRTVIIKNGDGTATAAIDGKDIEANCPGLVTTVDASAEPSADKKERAKIVLCTKGGTKAEQVEGLKKALARVQSDGEMDAALKARVVAQLQAKIAELGG